MKFILSILLSCVCFIAAAQKCPTIAVKGPASYTIAETESLIFTAEVNPANNNATYNWMISAGTIVSGQGTKTIIVQTDGLGGMTVTATIEIGGLDKSCASNASITIDVLELDFDYHNWKAPYKLDTLKGGSFERFGIPISFAPSIDYTGVEDIRFTPGWAKKTTKEYWSYAFLWYLDGKKEFSEKTIERNLNAYYTGLVKANIDTLVNAKSIIRSRAKEKNDFKTFEGSVTMLDYMTRKPIRLNVVVHIRFCPGKDKTYVFHELSPTPYTDEAWKKLHQLWVNFKCDN